MRFTEFSEFIRRTAHRTCNECVESGHLLNTYKQSSSSGFWTVPGQSRGQNSPIPCRFSGFLTRWQPVGLTLVSSFTRT